MNNATDTGSVQMTIEPVGALPGRLESAQQELLRVQSANLYDYSNARKNSIYNS